MRRAAIRFATPTLIFALILLGAGLSSADDFNMTATVVKGSGSAFKAVNHAGVAGQTWVFVFTTDTKIASVDMQLYSGAESATSDQVCAPATIMGQTFAQVLSFRVKGNQLRDGTETVTTTVGDSVNCVRLVLTGSTGARVSAAISH